MDKLPVLDGRDLVRILERDGFYVHHRPSSGSHITMKRDNPPCRITILINKPIKRGLLRSIISQAGLTREEFLRLAEEI